MITMYTMTYYSSVCQEGNREPPVRRPQAGSVEVQEDTGLKQVKKYILITRLLSSQKGGYYADKDN